MDDDEDDITVEVYECHETHEEVDEVEHEVAVVPIRAVVDELDAQVNETMVELVVAIHQVDDEVGDDTAKHDVTTTAVIIVDLRVGFDDADIILI